VYVARAQKVKTAEDEGGGGWHGGWVGENLQSLRGSGRQQS
jgi:hypothetical protein